MPKSADVIVGDIHERMKHQGKQFVTMTWKEFYAAGDIQRFGGPLDDRITKAAKSRGLLFGYGDNVVIFSYDANYAGFAA